MKVRAIRTGYYDHVRRREGDVFELREIKHGKSGKVISVQQQFSSIWMERVDRATPEKVSTAQKALNAASSDIKSGRSPQSRDVGVEAEAG